MSILDLLKDQLDAKTIGSLAASLGIDSKMAESAIASALPTIIGALAKNASKPEGADKLGAALDRDHDGSVMSQLGAAAPELIVHGQKILAHILGPKKEAAAGGVAEKSGLPMADVMAIFGTLAPIVMGAIGKKKKEEGLDAAGVAEVLKAERPQAKEQAGGILGMLDADGDGDIMDDLAKHAASLSSLFGGSKA